AGFRPRALYPVLALSKFRHLSTLNNCCLHCPLSKCHCNEGDRCRHSPCRQCLRDGGSGVDRYMKQLLLLFPLGLLCSESLFCSLELGVDCLFCFCVVTSKF